MALQKSISKPTVMAGRKVVKKESVTTTTKKALLPTPPTTPVKSAPSPVQLSAQPIATSVMSTTQRDEQKQDKLADLLLRTSTTPSPLLDPLARQIWTNHYLEVNMPVEWLERPNLIGTNLMSLRGAVVMTPIITDIKRDNGDLRIGKFLLRVWNQTPSIDDPQGFSQVNTCNIFATGFDQVADAIAKLKTGDHVMVHGYLNCRKYERKFEGNVENIVATCYDTSVTVKSLIKFVFNENVQDSSALPDIPYETQDF